VFHAKGRIYVVIISCRADICAMPYSDGRLRAAPHGLTCRCNMGSCAFDGEVTVEQLRRRSPALPRALAPSHAV